MAADLERVMPRPRPPSEPARALPTETIRRPRCALAAFESAAPGGWRGRASRRGEAPGSDPDPGHVVQAGAGNPRRPVPPRRDREHEPSFSTLTTLAPVSEPFEPAGRRTSAGAGAIPTSRNTAHRRAQAGEASEVRSTPHVNPTPCPSPPVHPAACLRQATGTGKSRALCALFFCPAVRGNDEDPGRQGATTNPRDKENAMNEVGDSTRGRRRRAPSCCWPPTSGGRPGGALSTAGSRARAAVPASPDRG